MMTVSPSLIVPRTFPRSGSLGPCNGVRVNRRYSIAQAGASKARAKKSVASEYELQTKLNHTRIASRLLVQTLGVPTVSPTPPGAPKYGVFMALNSSVRN